MNRKKEKEEKKVSKIRLCIYGDRAVIHRKGGLPFIEDKALETVLWLAQKGYNPEEIEVLGEKPSNWEAAFKITEDCASA